MRIKTVNNDKQGWETINKLRRKYRKQGLHLRLRGRHSDRQSLLPELRERFPDRNEMVLKYGLRDSVPVELSEVIAVYVVKPRKR